MLSPVKAEEDMTEEDWKEYYDKYYNMSMAGTA